MVEVCYSRFCWNPVRRGLEKVGKNPAKLVLSMLLIGSLSSPIHVRSQAWDKVPALPTDMSDILSSISKDSNLYSVYQQYRQNRDGLQKAAERITLSDAIARGVATSPELALTVAQIQESEWGAVAIRREWVPTLSFKTSDPGVLGYNTSSTTLKTKTAGSPSKENFTYSNGYVSNPYADLSWTFFDPTRGVRQSARGMRTDALRNRLTFTTRELIFAIQAAYVTLQESLEGEKDLIELFNQAIYIYINAFKAQRPVGEVSRLEAAAVSLLIARINAHQESIQAMNALASLINLEPGKLAIPSEKAKVIPIWSWTRADSIQQALQRREELRANGLDAQALMSDARAIRLKVFPTLALSGQVQRIGGSTYDGGFNDDLPSTLERISGYSSFVGLTFDWKVFDGGIRYAEANATDAKVRQTLAEGQLIRLRIGKQVADAYATFVSSKIQVDAARADVDASRRSLNAAIANYQAGRHSDDGTTVVQALAKLQSALAIYRRLVADQNISIHQLYRSTSTWPEQTESLVQSQYQRWLAPSMPAPTIPLAPQSEKP